MPNSTPWAIAPQPDIDSSSPPCSTFLDQPLGWHFCWAKVSVISLGLEGIAPLS